MYFSTSLLNCHKVWAWHTTIIDHINFLKGWYKSAVLMVWSSANSKFQGILVKQFFSCLINIQISIQWQNSLLALFWNQDQIVIINLTKLLFFQIECSIPKKKGVRLDYGSMIGPLSKKPSLFYAATFSPAFLPLFLLFQMSFLRRH